MIIAYLVLVRIKIIIFDNLKIIFTLLSSNTFNVVFFGNFVSPMVYVHIESVRTYIILSAVFNRSLIMFVFAALIQYYYISPRRAHCGGIAMVV